jgi:Spy/CpxP family protein refolding chaperone
MKRLSILVTMAMWGLMATAWAQSDPVAAANARADAARQEQLRAQVDNLVAQAARVTPTAPRPLSISPGIQVPVLSTVNGVRSVQFASSSTSSDPLSSLQVAPGTWWNNADTATRLNLTKDQQKKMDDIFQQFRLKLSKEELIMDPLIAAEKLDETKILTQIDRIALARAELEKANSRMLLGIRQSLTMEQWTKIQASPSTYRTLSVIKR